MQRLMRAVERLLAVAFILAVLLNFANVVGRYGFGRSLSGADEVQVYVMVCMAFLGAAVVASQGTHLRMDVLARMLGERWQTALRAAEAALMIAIGVFTTFESYRYAAQMAALGRTSDMAGIPMWIPHGAVALGFALITVCALLGALELLRRR